MRQRTVRLARQTRIAEAPTTSGSQASYLPFVRPNTTMARMYASRDPEVDFPGLFAVASLEVWLT